MLCSGCRGLLVADLTAIFKVLGIALACGVVLAATNWLTADRIRFNEDATLRNAIAALLPEDAQESLRIPPINRLPGAWRLCSGYLLGHADVPGYAGPIRLLFTLHEPMEGPVALTRLTLLAHQETPGITDFLSEPDWISSFHGRTATEIAGLATVTGATITSRALIEHLARMTADPRDALSEPQDMDCEP